MVITFNPKEALASIANIFVVACLQSHGMSLDAATEIGAITEGAIKGVGIKKSPKKLHSNVYDKLEKAIKQSISLAIQSSVVSHLPDDFINVIFDSAFSFNSIRVYLSADNPVMALEEVLKASLTSSDIYDVDAIPIDQIAVDIINNIDESIQSDSELAVLATYYKVSEISSILFDYFSSNEHLKLDDFFESYGQAAKRQYEELTHDGNKFHNLNIITDIFPEASVCELDFNGLDENNEILQLMEFVEQYDFENLLLLGEGGIGKTTILFYILQSYYNGSAKFPQIPLYIELNRCPSNLDSWCIDDKNSIFIEKYIAGLLLGRKNVGKDNEFIDKIQYEFQKEPPKGIPQYMVLLDGLNEVASGTSTGYSIRTILESEIAQDLQKYRNVRFIITSRNNSRKIKGVKRINILGVSKEGIEAYLRAEEEKGNIKKGVTDKVLKSDELLDCLRIPLFLNMFGVVSGDTTISTRGEILREFFYKKRSNLYSSKIEGEKINGFILDFIVPEIAWEMTQKDTFTISFTEVQKIVDKILLNEKESMALNRYSQKCFDYIEPPSYLCGVVLSMFNERQRTIGILDIMVESLAIVYGDDGGYRFKHHHFRDYFSALFIINEIKLGTCLFDNIGNEWSYLENIKKYKLHKDTIQFISESIGLHHSNPTYTPDKKWTMRKWDENNGIIRILLNVYRECFDNSNGWSVWNIVQILNYSGMGLLGIDLSDLDLRNINFNGILCGIGTNSSELATKFDNSIIDLNYFLPIGHHETMVDVKYSSNGIYILTVSDSRMIIWNSDYEYVNKIDINKKISKAIFSGDSNNVVFYTEDFEIRIWNLWDGEEYILNESQFEICDLCSGDSDNCVYIGYRNGNIKKLNIPDHKWIKRTLRVGQTISQIMFDKKYGHIVVKTENGQIFYGDELHNNFRNLPYSKIKQVTLAQNGEKYGFVTMDNCIEVGDLYGEQLQCVNCNCENVSFIQLSPDGRYLAIVEDKLTLQIVDLNTNKYNRPISKRNRTPSRTLPRPYPARMRGWPVRF